MQSSTCAPGTAPSLKTAGAAPAERGLRSTTVEAVPATPAPAGAVSATEQLASTTNPATTTAQSARILTSASRLFYMAGRVCRESKQGWFTGSLLLSRDEVPSEEKLKP